MLVKFAFQLGERVTSPYEPGLFTGVVDCLMVRADGSRLVSIVSPADGFVIQTTDGKDWHCEQDLTAADPANATTPAEPIFTLRARDILAAETVRFWARLAEESNVPEAKIAGALQIADAMDAWPEHRLPD